MFTKTISFTVIVIPLLFSVLSSHDVSEKPPNWTYYLRGGVAVTDGTGSTAFTRLKRVHKNTFYDLQIFGYSIKEDMLLISRYKSSRRFITLPNLYKFTIISLRHSTESNLTIRYHYNQGLGAFLYNNATGHLTGELALSYDLSDYLNDTRKTSYLKGGAFWDVSIGLSSLSIDFEYYQQISDIVIGEEEQTRYEISAKLDFPIKNTFQLTIGYEEEFYKSPYIGNIRSVYIAIGIKRLIPLFI